MPVAGCLLWGGMTYVDERQRAVEQAYENVALVRQYAQRLIETQTILQDAAAAFGRTQDDPGFLRSEAFHQFLAEIESAQTSSYGLAVVAFDGTLIASSRSFPANHNFGQRDYLTAAEAGSELFLDRLILQPSGKDALVVVQPFEHQSFSGAIVSALGVEAIREFLAGIAARNGESASLLRGDGRLLVRHVPSTPMFLDPSSPSLQAIQQSPSGHYQAKAVSDGVERLYAYRQLGDLPIYANFGIPSRLIWNSWFWRAAPVWLLLLVGGAFSFTLASMVRRSLDERAAHQQQALLRREAEQRAEQQQQRMRELNHRVKNSLALIDSLISMQMRKKGHVDGDELRARVAAIADVHDLLHRAADAHRVDLGELLEQVCRSPALIPKERNIELDLQTTRGVVVEAGKATSLTLAAVELLTNAVKHAFPIDRPGRITIRLDRHQNGAVLLVGDNGIGFPEANTRSSGTRIVEALIHQVDGQITREAREGTFYRITFPADADAGNHA